MQTYDSKTLNIFHFFLIFHIIKIKWKYVCTVFCNLTIQQGSAYFTNSTQCAFWDRKEPPHYTSHPPPWLCGCRVEEEFVTIKPVHHMLPRSREIVIFCLSICISPGLGHLGQLMRSYKCFHLHLQTLLPAVTPLCLNPKYVVRSCSRAFLCLCDGWYMQQFFTKRTTIVTTDALCKSALRYCHGLLLLSF